MAPDPSAPTTAPSPAVSRGPGCLAATLAHRSCLRRPSVPAGLRLRLPPEGDQRPGVTRRPLRSPVTVADSSLHPIARRRSSARSEVAGEHCPCSDFRCASRAMRGGPKPHPHRSVRRALSGTRISKYAAKPLVNPSFEKHRLIHGTSSLPPGIHRPSTCCTRFIHSDVHSMRSRGDELGGDDVVTRVDIRPLFGVQWVPMTNSSAAIIIIP